VNGRASGDGHCAPIGNDSPAGVTWSRGEHLENAPFLALFALLMWDALFAPLPGAFGSSAQDAPDDLVRGGRGAFSGRRAAMITRLLEEIESAESAVDCHGAVHCTGEGDCSSPNEGSHSAEADQADASARGPPSLASRLATSYAAHYGTECIGIAWDRLELPLLQWMASALGGQVVAAICRTLADDYTAMCHGAPDLLLLADRPRLAARLVEVKGPGDKLSDSQQVWLDALLSAGADVAVAHVQAVRV